MKARPTKVDQIANGGAAADGDVVAVAAAAAAVAAAAAAAAVVAAVAAAAAARRKRGRRRREASRERRTLQHDAAVDAALLATRDGNLIECREVAKHPRCQQGKGAPIMPDGMMLSMEGTVVQWDAHPQEEATRPASLAIQRASRW